MSIRSGWSSFRRGTLRRNEPQRTQRTQRTQRRVIVFVSLLSFVSFMVNCSFPVNERLRKELRPLSVIRRRPTCKGSRLFASACSRASADIFRGGRYAHPIGVLPSACRHRHMDRHRPCGRHTARPHRKGAQGPRRRRASRPEHRRTDAVQGDHLPRGRRGAHFDRPQPGPDRCPLYRDDRRRTRPEIELQARSPRRQRLARYQRLHRRSRCR